MDTLPAFRLVYIARNRPYVTVKKVDGGFNSVSIPHVVERIMIDSHCHFDFDVFDQHRTDIWRRCVAQGVSALLIPGIDPNQWQKAAALCDKYHEFYYAAGLHPWFIDHHKQAETRPDLDVAVYDEDSSLSALFELLVKQLGDKQCIAVGECGLDKAQAKSGSYEINWQTQIQVFKAHVELAKRYRYPIIVHSVKAHAEVLSILKAAKLDAGGVIHAFTGSTEIAKQYWQLGFYLGIGGAITYQRARKTRDAVKAMPMEALLLETDAPSMPLSGQQGQHNSPENLPLIVRDLATLKGLTENDVSKQSSDNFYRLFRLDHRGYSASSFAK